MMQVGAVPLETRKAPMNSCYTKQRFAEMQPMCLRYIADAVQQSLLED